MNICVHGFYYLSLNFQNPEIQNENFKLYRTLKHIFYHFSATKNPFKVIINKRKVIHLQVKTYSKVH